MHGHQRMGILHCPYHVFSPCGVPNQREHVKLILQELVGVLLEISATVSRPRAHKLDYLSHWRVHPVRQLRGAAGRCRRGYGVVSSCYET